MRGKRAQLLPRIARLLSICGVAMAALAAIGKEVQLTGPQIRAAISGKYVTDEHHWGHKYFPDGRVERTENHRRRPARWSVKADRLCLLRPEVSKDQPICYRVIRDGNELQYRDDRSVVYQGLIRPMPRETDDK